MDATANLRLPYILPSQAQKAVTHNEALRRLDAVVMLAVKSRALASPPAEAAEGDRYVVPAGALGAWAGKAGLIASRQDEAWDFVEPRDGWIAWCVEEENLLCFSDGDWQATNALTLENVPRVGVNTVPDDTNRLAVASNASLFSHAGAGHRIVVNKNATADTASLVFQTGFSGRAEIGLTGNDRLTVRVSPDGSTFKSALDIDPASGKLAFPATNVTQSLALNLYSDAGRFSSTAPGNTTVGAFAWPSYLSVYNGATAAQHGKFIYDNTDYGGSGGTLQADVRALIDTIRDPAFRRYSVEFWVAVVTAGSGTSGSPVTIGSETGYLSLFTTFRVRPPTFTFHAYLRALDDAILVAVAPSQTLTLNGIARPNPFAIRPSDGWVSVTIHDEVNPRTSYGYQPMIFSAYSKWSGNRFLLACPALIPAITKVSDDIGVVASYNTWTS